MSHLSVTVSMGNDVVDTGVFEVKRKLPLGEAPKSRLAFPGAKVWAVRKGKHVINVRGVDLLEGEELSLGIGELAVVLRHLEPQASPLRRGTRRFDGRFAAAFLVVLTTGLWLDSFETLRSTWGSEQEALGASMEHEDGIEAALSVPESLEEAGSRDVTTAHVPNDERSGLGWASWAFESTESLSMAGPVEQMYFRGDFTGVAESLANTEMNAGSLELRAAALIRLGRYAEAQLSLLEASSLQPQDASIHLQLSVLMARRGLTPSPIRTRNAQGAPEAELAFSQAVLSSLQGDSESALTVLEPIFASWDEVDPTIRREIRIGLAIDPVFAQLRSNPRLESMLYRNLGSTAPARLR